MKKTLTTLTVATAIGLTAPAFAAEKVAIGVPSWTGAQAIAHLLAEVVESRIGGEANLVPGNMRVFMDWNPLFHLLDYGRDAAFQNYSARTTDLSYAIYVYLAIFVLAMLVEAHVRRHYSASHMPGG